MGRCAQEYQKNMKEGILSRAAGTGLTFLWLCSGQLACFAEPAAGERGNSAAHSVEQAALAKVAEGRQTFRYDTFGDQSFWGGALKLHQAIAGANLGGVGPGVSPSTALAVGLKVDAEALPDTLKQQLAAGQVDLTSPATTVALLELNAVVGVTGFFDQQK